MLHAERSRVHWYRSRPLSVTISLGRRLAAEATGSALLVATVVGSGIFAQRLSPDDVGLQLLENSIATGAVLVALILTFGWVSGAHFNPVVTLAERAFGGISTRVALVYVAAQVMGCCVGAVAANVMFELPAVQWSTDVRSGGAVWFSEGIATFGLLVVILGVVRSGRAAAVPFAVGGYIAAAYWFTSSTSFANPAVTIGRTLTDSFAGIAPSAAPAFIASQLVAAVAAIAFARYVFHEPSGQQLIVEHASSADT